MTINFDDFTKVELQIGKIVEAEKINGSEKLLKLKVDLGETNPEGEKTLRQILAGIGKTYTPESLISKEALFITNLEPRMIMGLESQGMILAASDETGPVIMTPDREVRAGANLH